ncbi:hypothetical protein [Cronobacter dublinensis]|uniref:hypothetical protein n=1 Tax=Cronobacter dublinensis TaxID=413497 RepID=UPI000CFC16EA|nr:hypothetical protein [Cronobacter dublinensis]
MGKVTFVVEFEDGKEPSVRSGMDVIGGKLVAVVWRDLMDDMEAMELNHQAELEHAEWSAQN